MQGQALKPDVIFKLLGIKLDPRTALALTIVIPLVVVGAGLVFAWWKRRRDAKAEAPPAMGGGGVAAGATLGPQQLRKAFQRFSAQLPPEYQRSLLNFEHFVVMGPASSGKSRLIDKVTDWKRQTKEFVSSQAVDPDLQVYLTSSSVVTEIPPAILDDHSPRARTALRNLWKPLYKDRAPTVVVVVDATRLAESTPEGLRDLAETLRAKINVIAGIRKAAIEVRVVLTRTDQLPGYAEFVEFAEASSLPTRIPLTITRGPDGKADIAGELERWFEGLRGHFPRALTILSSDAYRRFLVFCGRLPEISTTLAPFLDVLFARESTSPDPIPSGVYLVSDSAKVSNPLVGAAERGPGPDPRRRHVFFAAGFASLAVLYLTVAYVQQRALWARAQAELDDYSPSAYGKEREARRREAIADFTYRPRSAVLRLPDFFGGARKKMRARFSESVREELLIPRLRQVALRGALPEDDGIALPQRRSLYYLGLLHSDHQDRMHVLDGQRLEIWSSMTGLSTDMIRDYVSTVDTPMQRPVDFELAAHELDPADTSASWVLFFRKVQESMTDGALSPEELDELRNRASMLTRALDRFDHDDVTQKILDELDDAAGLGDKGGGRLKLAYQPKYSDFLQNIASSDVLGQRDSLRRILVAVQKSSIETSSVPLLRALVDRVSLLYAAASAERPDDIVRIRLAGQEYEFDVKKWDLTLVDSSAAEEISQFIRRNSSAGSIFFAAADDDVRPVVWNPTNDGSVLFTGRASIDGRFTKPAYDKNVRAAIKRATEMLEKTHVPQDRKTRLQEFVKEQVRRYAGEYRRQLVAFYRAFNLNATSPEALRVAIAQMVSDTSPFNDFLTAVDNQVTLEVDDPLLEPMNDVVTEFSAWHAAVSPGSGAPEIAKYKAILAQLLADLGPAPETSGAGTAAGAAVAAAEPPTGTAATLEKLLSPAGRLVLANLRGDKGSYGALVGAWVASIKIPEYQQAPFVAPIVQLSAVGRRDVENVVEQAWDREMAPDLARLAERFPFSREAKEDVSPQELAAVLHPQSGRFFEAFRRFIEPITEVDASGYHLKKRLRGNMNVPSGMYTLVNQAAVVSTKLWDPAGRPMPLELHIATVPFEHGPDPRLALTLTYMNAGETPVLNFNQKPSEKTVRFDWTKEQASQVGMQLTDLDTKESTFPDPLVVETSFWSIHKLLRLGVPTAVKHPPDATLYTWELKVRRGRTESSRVRFVVIGDPFQAFALSKSPTRGRTARLKEAN